MVEHGRPGNREAAGDENVVGTSNPDLLGGGGSVSAAARAFRMSRPTVRTVKNGTYASQDDGDRRRPSVPPWAAQTFPDNRPGESRVFAFFAWHPQASTGLAKSIKSGLLNDHRRRAFLRRGSYYLGRDAQYLVSPWYAEGGEDAEMDP